jgi:hypothetical protein
VGTGEPGSNRRHPEGGPARSAYDVQGIPVLADFPGIVEWLLRAPYHALHHTPNTVNG